jgi:ATP-dependent Clp protease ATP-binding subunit ClpC
LAKLRSSRPCQKIIDHAVPSFLENKRILSLDLSLVVAGTKYRGQFEERLKKIMAELRENDEHIVFIDELHTLVGAGSAEGTLDAANILKPALSRGEIQVIGATTPANTARRSKKIGRWNGGFSRSRSSRRARPRRYK